MKVLHAAETIQGGVATVMRSLLADQLSRPGVHVQCLIPHAHKQELPTFSSASLRTFPGKKRSLFRHLLFMLVFMQQVVSFRPDVVHLHSTFAGFLGRLSLLLLWPFHRPRVIYCPHAFAFLMSTSGTQKTAYAFIERALAPLTHVIICVSMQEHNTALAAGLPAQKLHLIHNGVAAQKEVHPAPAGPRLQLLFIGRFDRQKGFDILLETMEKLPAKSFHLTAIGAPVHGKSMPHSQANITYTGWLTPLEVHTHMQTADIVIVPSRWEGFAMVPLEAMAAGRPVVVSSGTSLTEVVEEGKTGKVFNAEDAKDLARVLTSKTDWQKLGTAARKHHAQNFTVEKMTAQTFHLYSKGAH